MDEGCRAVSDPAGGGSEGSVRDDLLSGVCVFCGENSGAEGWSKESLEPRSALSFSPGCRGREKGGARRGAWVVEDTTTLDGGRIMAPST